MNELEKFVRENGFNPAKALDSLQLSGVVSDNCVRLADVASADVRRAIRFLMTGEK